MEDDGISKGNSLLCPLTAVQLIKCSAWPLFLSLLSLESTPQAPPKQTQFKLLTGRIHAKHSVWSGSVMPAYSLCLI